MPHVLICAHSITLVVSTQSQTRLDVCQHMATNTEQHLSNNEMLTALERHHFTCTDQEQSDCQGASSSSAECEASVLTSSTSMWQRC